MKTILSHILLVLSLFCNPTHAQHIDSLKGLSSLVVKKIPVTPKGLRIDSRSIVPGSFSAMDIPQIWYELNELQAIFLWKGPSVRDSIQISYRVFPFLISEKLNHVSYDSIKYNFLANNTSIIRTTKTNSPASLFDFGGLQAEGSIGRALSFGNNRDANLNSSLNLQLNGMIGDSMEITAAITDNSIPIQPDGNTRDLRDLDKIFIQLKKNNWQISMGDLDLKESESYGLNFYKRIQGASLGSTFNVYPKIKTAVEVTGSVAKGKFTRNFLKPIEGNQGPYRLQGANNEFYFIVLAGSEKVFIDGVRMQRGEDEDYVINYNTAEISFTPKQLITKDKRIQVEFEYSDRNYLNTQLFFKNKWELGDKLKLHWAYFSSADVKSSPIDQAINDDDRNYLEAIGDSIQRAFVSSAFPENYGSSNILYQKIDTLYNGINDSIYRYAPLATENLYQVSFTFVGAGNGNYQQNSNIANGKVFSWISPEANGQKRGDFEPVRFLVTPKKQTVLSLGLTYQPKPNQKIMLDVASSNYDVNRFSTLDKSNNQGQAFKLQTHFQTDTFQLARQSFVLSNKSHAEWIQQSFKSPERLRSTEFYRDWGLSVDAGFDQEKLFSSEVSLQSKRKDFATYRFEYFERGNATKATRQQYHQNYGFKKWTIETHSSFLVYNQYNNQGVFIRPNIDIKKKWTFKIPFETGFNFQLEKNKLSKKGQDSISLGSFSFHRWEAYVKADSLSKHKWILSYFTRADKIPQGTKFERTDKSNNYQFGMELLSNAKRQWRHSIGFRELKVFNENLSKQKSSKSLLTRAEYYFNEINNGLTGSMLYEIGGGQEQKKVITYLAVPVGQGNYTWIDYNNNGIEELNEFELAQFADQKKYAQIFTPSNEFIATQYVQWNTSIDVQPEAFLGDKKSKIFSILRKTQLNSNIQLSKKRTSGKGFFFDPFLEKSLDTTLVSGSQSMYNAFFYNRTNTKWGLDLTQSAIRSKALLNYGWELNKNNQWNLKLRWNINRKFNVIVVTKTSKQVLKNSSSNFSNRNYELSYKAIEPQLVYLKANRFRMQATGTYALRMNILNQNNKTESKGLKLDAKYNALSSTSIASSLKFQQLNYSSGGILPGTAIGFIMLESLQPGKNWIWQVDVTKRLAGNIECNVQYNGRQSEKTRTVHLGSASLRVLF